MRPDIRNICIIAHVDHGKTTLVDAMLKQGHVFRENQQVGELIMDFNELEREKGITILAKNTAITYRGIKINIIDTPGHADFSGEVERVLNMADGCLLVVDALDSPTPQTRFVLKNALEKGLKPIVVISKLDRPMARPAEVLGLVQDLFLDLVTDASQLDFPVLYASGKQGYAVEKPGDPPKSMEPLFEAIVNYVPPPQGDASKPFQMLVAALQHDNYLGQIVVGCITRGKVSVGDKVARIDAQGQTSFFKVTKLFVFEGLARLEVESVDAGEIIAMAGVEGASISDTISSAEHMDALPGINIGEPTVQMTFGVNSSPFAGQDGEYVTSRQLRARLYQELQTNVSLQVHDTDSADEFLVSGRGELHLAILIETMRREGYEFQVSRPEAIIKVVEGKRHEPFEHLVLEIGEQFVGILTEELAARLAQMKDMRNDGQGHLRVEYKIPTRGLIGFRGFFLRATRGDGVMHSIFTGYELMKGEIKGKRTGVLTSAETGIAVAYGLNNAQERGQTFVGPGTPVYEGMIVGFHPKDNDLVVNICKEKKLTNIRSSTSDFAIRLTPPVVFSLEEALNFIAADECVEVTPKNMRLRKHVLSNDQRYRLGRDKARAAASVK